MRRDVNVVLLGLVVVLLLVIVGLSVYYQSTYASLMAEYRDAYDELSQRVELLEAENANLSARIVELNTSAVRSRELGERYADVVKERDDCKVELFAANERIASLQKTNYVLSGQVEDFKRLRAEMKGAVDSLDTYLVGDLSANYTILRDNITILKQVLEDMAAVN